MAHSIKLSTETMELLRSESKLQSRSIAGQAEHWMRLGRAIEHSPLFNYERIKAALEGRLDADTLSADEQDMFFEELAGAMWETTPAQEAFFSERRRKGLGVGMNDDGELVYAKKSR